MMGTGAAGRLGAVLLALLAGDLSAAAGSADCPAPPALMAVGPVLDHAARRVERGERLTILAIGSSSTLGVGASSPAASYPSRLQAELQARYPNHDIRVINRGVGGEDAPEEFARLRPEVDGDHPDLVIWQVGTNAVLRRDDLATDDRLIERGVDLLKDSNVDVVLMDLQYAPRVLARPAYAEMEHRIADIAKQGAVGLFRRFDIMRAWGEGQRIDAPAMVGADGLHMTDAGYACLAADLADALAQNWRSRQIAGTPPRTAAGRTAGIAPPAVAATGGPSAGK
jgi:acyl-CoA thioesterase-1